MADSEEKFLSPGEVAKKLMVSTASVRLWAEKGDIKALTTPGGHRRFRESEVARFSAQRGMRVSRSEQLKLSVLIVDDDIQFTNYLKKLLQKFEDKVDVEVVSDGFAAGLMISEHEPDIVLLDLMMPGLDGFSVCERIKSTPTTADIRVIAMTGYPSAENVNKIIATGAELCLTKPVDKDELLKLLELI